MEKIETVIEIAAPPARIWGVLVDFNRYPEWNPFIPSVKGKAETGEQLEVLIQPPSQKAMQFRPVVLRADRERELRWRGKLFVPGLFDGEHSFTIEPIAVGRSRLRHSETFTGLLVPLLAKQLRTSTRAGFEQMNFALKQRVEGTVPGAQSADY
jgi:hypothetical protein